MARHVSCAEDGPEAAGTTMEDLEASNLRKTRRESAAISKDRLGGDSKRELVPSERAA